MGIFNIDYEYIICEGPPVGNVRKVGKIILWKSKEGPPVRNVQGSLFPALQRIFFPTFLTIPTRVSPKIQL